ncbi:hypothetical protein Acr_00g0025240 [Actinidia rufa]|uniref:Uncharacterized protein n=1 Tax=Actinidia rufa TaxID=165716 RepID=A0A7J0DDD0_9ERIC|nr:hypothetical protein Acr_00g0025240 [Actinidia rufa]
MTQDELDHLEELCSFLAGVQIRLPEAACQCNAAPSLTEFEREMPNLVTKTFQPGEFYSIKDILCLKLILKCFSLTSPQMASNGGHNAEEKHAVMLAKFNLKKLSKLAKAKCTKAVKTPPTGKKGIHIDERLSKKAKTTRDGAGDGFSSVDQAREMRDGVVIQGITISSMRDEINRAQQTARDFEKSVSELMTDKERSDTALARLEEEVVDLNRDKRTPMSPWRS